MNISTVVLHLLLLSAAQADVISFGFSMKAVKSESEIPVTTDLGSFEEYEFFIKNETWIPTDNFKISRIESQKYAVIGFFKGEAGLYRIYKKPTAYSPYGCDVELDVQKHLNGKQITILNQVVEYKIGSIKLVTKNGEPHKNVKVRSVNPNVAFFNKDGVTIAPEYYSLTNENGEIHLKFIADDSPLMFRIRNDFIHDNLNPIFKKFEAEKLEAGEKWIIDEVPVQAVFEMFVMQNGIPRKFSVAEAKSVFGDMWLPVYVQNSSTKNFSLQANNSYYSDEHDALVFRGGLPVDKILYLGNTVETSNGDFSVDNKRTGHFQINNKEIFKGAVYILGAESAKPSTRVTKIQVLDYNKSPLAEASVEIYSIRNTTLLHNGKTDAQGIFNVQLQPEEHGIRIKHINHKPLPATKKFESGGLHTFEMKSIDYINVTLNWDEPDSRTQGELFVFSTDVRNPIVSIGVIDQEVLKLPLRSDGPVFVLFQSRTAGLAHNEPIYGEYVGRLEIANRELDQYSILMTKSTKSIVTIRNTKFRSCKILLYAKWGKRYLPVGSGEWTFDNTEESFVHFPGNGIYKPLMIFEETLEGQTFTRAYWGKEITVDRVLNSFVIHPENSTIHNFKSPFDYNED